MAKKKEVRISKEEFQERELKRKQWKKSFKLKELERLKRVRAEIEKDLLKIDAQICKVKKELDELKDIPEGKNWYSPF